MKKIVLLFVLILGFSSMAEGSAVYTATKATFKILVNGAEFTPDNPAVVIDGKTYLPLRSVGEALGVKINWNDKIKQAEIGYLPGEAQVVKGISFFNFKTEKTPAGYKMMCEAQNTTKEKRSFIYTVTFYDENKNLLGTASGAKNDVVPMEIVTAESFASTEFETFGSFKFQIDTVY